MTKSNEIKTINIDMNMLLYKNTDLESPIIGYKDTINKIDKYIY